MILMRFTRTTIVCKLEFYICNIVEVYFGSVRGGYSSNGGPSRRFRHQHQRSVPYAPHQGHEQHQRAVRYTPHYGPQHQQEVPHQGHEHQHAVPSTSHHADKSTDPMTRPIVHGFQLLGDSHMLRYARNILKEKFERVGFKRCVGFCVSGQTIAQLQQRLEEGFAAKQCEKALMLIGTNDFLKGRPLENVIEGFESLRDELTIQYDDVYYMTVPLIKCKKELDDTILEFNEYIKKVCKDKVFDLCSEVQNDEFYEGFYSDGSVDGVHLNDNGNEVVTKLLDKLKI